MPVDPRDRWTEDGITWLGTRLLCEYVGPERPHITRARLSKIQLEAADGQASPVPGRIRFIRRTVQVPTRGGATRPGECFFFHPDDARKAELPYRMRTNRKAAAPLPPEALPAGVKRCDDAKRITPGAAYRLPDKRVCVTVGELVSRFQTDSPNPGPVVEAKNWRRMCEWCPDLARPLEAYIVDDGKELVILLDDAEAVVKRRTSRQFNETAEGRWLGDDVFQHTTLGTCVSSSWSSSDRDLDVSSAFARYWRRHPHPALPTTVNDGNVRTVLLPPRQRRPGARPKTLFVLDDLNAVRAWERRLEKAGSLLENPKLAEAEPVDQEGVCQQMPKALQSPAARQALRALLKQFRTEQPSASCRQFWASGKTQRSTGWQATKGKSPRKWYATNLYVSGKFLAWLQKRCKGQPLGLVQEQAIQALARAARKSWQPWRLGRAVAFIKFMLTQQAASARDAGRFREFLTWTVDERPRPFNPLPQGVPVQLIRELAREQGIGRDTFNAARSLLRKRGLIKRCHAEERGAHLWKLARPVVVGGSEEASPTAEPGTANPGKTKQTRKRHAGSKHAAWKEWRKAGMTYGEIAQKHLSETGEEVSREAVYVALKRLSSPGEV